MEQPLDLDGDVHAGRQVEFLELIHRLRRRLDDVEQALVGAHFELVHGLLVDVRRAVHGESLDLGRQRDRAGHLGAGALGGLDDLGRGAVEQAVIECLEADANALSVCHKFMLPFLIDAPRDDLRRHLFEVRRLHGVGGAALRQRTDAVA